MGTTGQSITLANSIIGVGILAMPFCFQQCGVLLATLILLFMGLVSRLCCYFLLKSALIARRRNFEFLAFHVFGPSGKWAVEVGIIGFLMGTCIAYFVVVGDLGPQIIAKMFNINQSDILRTSIMVIVSLVCVLPLGLLRNVDSLSNVSAATIGFYFCLVMKVIAEAASQLLTGEWQTRMEMWKPSGVLQCVPIFSMALFCQTQLFEIFESLPSLSLEKMNVVTKNAINICTGVYFTLGLFGYIAFCSQNISGNILMSLSPTMASDVIKLGFVMSLAFSFPLIIFPCRASLYSFLYRKAHPSHHDHIINHSIPETTFRCITVSIIAVALFISLLIPNIELVLGLVGSTIGVLVCVVFPAACFINLTFKDTNERVLAKVVLVLGLVVLVLGTFANLQAAENKVDRYDDKITQERIDKIVEDFFESKKSEKSKGVFKTLIKNDPVSLPQEDAPKISNEIKDSEIQPPNPVPPESQSNEKNSKSEVKEVKDTEKNKQVIPEVVKEKEKVPESHPKDLKPKLDEVKLSNGAIKKDTSKVEKLKEEVKSSPNQEKIDMMKQQQLIETIKQHGEEQKELIKEQKEILDEIIKTKKELQENKKEVDSNEAKKIAVESIQKIANMAIKSLSGVSEKPVDQVINADKKSEPLENIANKAVQEIAKKAVETIEAIKEINEKPKDQLPQNEINLDKAGGNKAGVSNDVINSAHIQNIQNNVQPDNMNSNLQANNHNSDNVNPVPVVQNNNAPTANQPNINIQSDISNSQPIVNNMQPVVKQDINAAQVIPNNNAAANQVIPDQSNQNKLSQNQENQNVPLQNQNSLVQNQNLPVQNQNSLVQNQNLPVQNQNLPVQNQNLPVQNQNLPEQNQNLPVQNQNLPLQNQNLPVHNQNLPVQNQNLPLQNQNLPVPNQNVPLQNQNIPNINNPPNKEHSHSPDEPQSYKQGEDLQKNNNPASNTQNKDINQNVPLPLAMNHVSASVNVESQIAKKDVKIENTKLNDNAFNNKDNKQILNKPQNNGAAGASINNNVKSNIENIINPAPLRQKREVVDCAEKTSLKPEDKEICKTLISDEYKRSSQEILPSKLDLNEIALPKSLPIDTNLIHHIRSLKSYDETERKR